MKKNYGYLCALSNPSMPGIVKIVMTTETPDSILKGNYAEWYMPTQFKLEFAKQVFNPKQKEVALLNTLSKYEERINPNSPFFRSSPETIKTFFELIDGDFWGQNVEIEEEDDEEFEFELFSYNGTEYLIDVNQNIYDKSSVQEIGYFNVIQKTIHFNNDMKRILGKK